MSIVKVHAHTADFAQPVVSMPLGYLFTKGDALTQQFDITVNYNGTGASLAGVSASIDVIRKDGATVRHAATINGSVISAALSEESCAIEGRIYIQAWLTTGTQAIKVWERYTSVEKGQSDVVVDPGETTSFLKTSVQTLTAGQKAQVIANIGAATAAQGALADTAVQPDELADSMTGGALYTSALRDLDEIFNVPACRTAIAAGSIKIAFVGDSITEGANSLVEDTWVYRFVSAVQKYAPGVTVTYTNFALGGRTLANFNNGSYVAANPETDPATNFWRSWATVGKSWKDHVSDYAADLTIIAFGMNDVGGSDPGSSFSANLASAVAYVKTVRTDMDVCLVSTILPTVNKTLYNQDEMETLNLARIAREYAKNNAMPLIDANRLWLLLRDGTDECKYDAVYHISSDVSALNCHDFQLTVTFSSIPSNETECDFKFGHYGNRSLLIRFYSDSGSYYAVLYSLNSGVPTLENTWSISGLYHTVIVRGSSIIVDGSLFTFYDYLYDGTFDISQFYSHLSAFELITRNRLSGNGVLSELQLLGDGNYNGNGINHPTPLASYMSYLMAGLPVVKSMLYGEAVLYPLTFQNSWDNYGSGYGEGRCAITKDGYVELSGLIVSGTITDGTVLFNVPTGFRPQAPQICNAAYAAGNCTFWVATNGNVTCQGIASGGWLSLNGVKWPIN